MGDFVWLAAEPLGGLVLGQEVSLNEETDVQCGDRHALAFRQGDYVKVEMVRAVDAADYAEKRRALFGAPSSSSPPPLLCFRRLRRLRKRTQRCAPFGSTLMSTARDHIHLPSRRSHSKGHPRRFISSSMRRGMVGILDCGFSYGRGRSTWIRRTVCTMS